MSGPNEVFAHNFAAGVTEPRREVADIHDLVEIRSGQRSYGDLAARVDRDHCKALGGSTVFPEQTPRTRAETALTHLHEARSEAGVEGVVVAAQKEIDSCLGEESLERGVGEELVLASVGERV